MKSTQDSLTELEGALLSAIDRFGECTAYQLRRAVQGSRSLEWSGSAGAVYPAIRRLVERGLIDSERARADGRGTARLSLTAAGRDALLAWAADISTAVGPGFDPFRARSATWSSLSSDQQHGLADTLEQALRKRIAELEAAMESEAHQRSRLQLDLALQRSRLKWLNAESGLKK